MIKNYEEWVKQADYDIETAECMLKSGRYIYTIFMSHLAIEKALKAIYTKKLTEMPPKNHSLIFFVEKLELQMPQELYDFTYTLNRVSVPTRYPDDLNRIMKDYTEEKTKEIYENSKKVLAWIKTQL